MYVIEVVASICLLFVESVFTLYNWYAYNNRVRSRMLFTLVCRVNSFAEKFKQPITVVKKIPPRPLQPIDSPESNDNNERLCVVY